VKSNFDRWIRDNAPPVRDDADTARHLWTRVEDRMHQRRQTRVTRGTGLVAAAVILLVVGFVDVTPLGGYNWNLVPTTRDGGNFADPFTGQPYMLQADSVGSLSGQQFWERVREQKAAGTFSLEYINFWDLDGEFEWSVFFGHWIDGKFSTASDSKAIDRPSTMSDETSTWLYPHAVAMDDEMASGIWRETSGRRYRVNGHDFWFHVWVKTTERGPLYYGSAVIPDDLK